MPRLRTLKPSFFTNEELAELPFEARLLFQGLWCWADRRGRLEDRPKRLRAEIFPYDPVDVDALLTKLHNHRFITRYEVNECRYIHIANFEKHQTPHIKEQDSTIPAPDMPGASIVPAPPVFGIMGSESLSLGSGNLEVESKVAVSNDKTVRDSLPARIRKKAANGTPAPANTSGSLVWNSYSQAIASRHNGNMPPRDAEANSLCKRFVAKIGIDDAPTVAAYYVTLNEHLYVQSLHCLNLMVRDAKKIYMLWKENGQMTNRQARDADQLQGAIGMAQRIQGRLDRGETLL